MEIIHTYKSEESEICVISDNTNIHLADKNDLAIESPKVGSVLKPSQINEVYLEMPIEVLQEVARRSGVFVEPDVEEEESSEENGEEEEEKALAAWEPLARAEFFEEYKALDEGVDVRILVNFPVKIKWEDGNEAIWNTSDGAYTLEDILEQQNGLESAVAAFNTRIASLNARIAIFTQDQIDIGHALGEDDVTEFLSEELESLNAEDDVADAAE